MGLFQRRKKADGQDATVDTQDVTNRSTISKDVDPELTDQAQEVIKDNLELMKEVVMRIRNEPDFAKNIYSKCPRLQHLLDQYPDLRPIFEDPKLVRINFEQVYRDAGGVLPEDEKKKKSCLVWLVNSPIFKVLKLLLFVKKLVACIAGGGIAFVSGCLMGCCFEDALEELDADADADGDGNMDPGKEALNKAADHMEDPEVQEQMQALLDDPDNLQEAIENDSELKALRDSNPLCEELMSDPETMRVLTDPDNLRALGEAPQLIEMDFANPDGFMPTDVETGGMDGLGDGGYDVFDGGNDADFGDVDADFDLDADRDADDGFDDDMEGEEEEEEEEEDEGWWEDAEMEEQEADGGDNGNNAGGKGKAQAKSQPKRQQQAQAAEGQGRFGGIMATIGVAATDLIAAQIVGSVFGDGIVPCSDAFGGGGGGGGMGGMEDMDGGCAALDDGGMADMADDAGGVIDDDLAAVAEDTMDEVDDKAVDGVDKDGNTADPDLDDDGKKKGGAAVGGAAAGGAVAGGAAATAGSRTKPEDDEENKDTFEDEEEEKPKKSRFGAIGKFAASVSTAAKEHVAATFLGDDWGEALVERQEEGGEGDSDDDDDDDKKKKKAEDEEKPKKRGMFGRKK